METQNTARIAGDGWEEWDDCRVCKATGVLTPEMVAAETTVSPWPIFARNIRRWLTTIGGLK